MTDRNDEHRSGNQTRNTGRQGQRQQPTGQGGQQYGRQQGYQQPQQQSQHNQPWQQSQQSGARGGPQHHAAEEYTAQDYGRAQAYGQEGLEREYGQSFDRGQDETSYGEQAQGGSAYGRDYGDRFSTRGQGDWEQERSDQFQYGVPRQDEHRNQGSHSQSQSQHRQGSRSNHAQGGRGSRDSQRQRQGSGAGGYQGGSQGYSGYMGLQQGEGYGNSSGYGSPDSDRYSGAGGYQGASFVSPADTQQSHAGMGRQSYSGKGPKNYTRSDERLTEDLCERLTMDHDIDASDVEVKVAQGTATLEGTVSQRWMKHRAEDIADGCPGVRNVENRIKVQSESSYGASSTQRSSGSQGDPLAGRTGSSSSGTAH